MMTLRGTFFSKMNVRFLLANAIDCAID